MVFMKREVFWLIDSLQALYGRPQPLYQAWHPLYPAAQTLNQSTQALIPKAQPLIAQKTATDCKSLLPFLLVKFIFQYILFIFKSILIGSDQRIEVFQLFFIIQYRR